MFLFAKKQQVKVSEWCEQFYDLALFPALIDEKNPRHLMEEVWYKSVLEVDGNFSKIDSCLFKKEMLAIHLEIIALACNHYCKNPSRLIWNNSRNAIYVQKIVAMYGKKH